VRPPCASHIEEVAILNVYTRNVTTPISQNSLTKLSTHCNVCALLRLMERLEAACYNLRW
jgi:hypothetical protein